MKRNIYLPKYLDDFWISKEVCTHKICYIAVTFYVYFSNKIFTQFGKVILQAGSVQQLHCLFPCGLISLFNLQFSATKDLCQHVVYTAADNVESFLNWEKYSSEFTWFHIFSDVIEKHFSSMSLWESHIYKTECVTFFFREPINSSKVIVSIFLMEMFSF